VALVSGGCSPGGNCGSGGGGTGVPPVAPPGTVLEQYTYEPYGPVIFADNLDLDPATGKSRHAVNRVGFQGLFFERYDGDYTNPTIAPGVAGLYHARNRFYSPTLGRFIQRDVNETALPIIAGSAMHGTATSTVEGSFNGQGLYGDGMNLYQFTEANPVNATDPTGLTHAYIDDGSWNDIFAGAASGLNSAFDTQNKLWAQDWGDDDYGDAVRENLTDRDTALTYLSYASSRATYGIGLSHMYAKANFMWLQVWFDYMSMEGALGIDINVCEFEDLAEFVECFATGTLVAAPDGLRVPIESIQAGDKVLSTASDPSAGIVPVSASVTAVFSRTANEYVIVAVGGDIITVTPEHPFWVPKDGWCAASSLIPGTNVGTANGVAEVQAVERCLGPLTVHNLQVEPGHTYFVGDGQELVHNVCSTQAHHIIPRQLEGHRALRGVNFQSNNRLNLSVNTHRGSHPKYTAIVKKRLNEISRDYKGADRAAAITKLQTNLGRALKRLEAQGKHMREFKSVRRIRLR
jgi:hypothetical protein